MWCSEIFLTSIKLYAYVDLVISYYVITFWLSDERYFIKDRHEGNMTVTDIQVCSTVMMMCFTT
jgi:hypothetical protein